MNKNRYIFFRNDQRQAHYDFDPTDPNALDVAEYKYFSRVFNLLEPQIRDQGITIIVTAWTVHELPEYGDKVVSFILQDEWGREPKYREKVGMVFKTCGLTPLNLEAFQYGDYTDIFANFLAQGKAFAMDGNGRLKTLIARLSGLKIAPVINLPIGCYAYETVKEIPFFERTNDLFFAGSVQHTENAFLPRPKELARARMKSSLTDLEKRNPQINIKYQKTANFAESIVTGNAEYLQNMANTKICPIPRGANLETFRFYEAIRYGCIPIGEAFPNNDFYRNAPILRLKHWSDLVEVIPALLKDQKRLEELHQQALEWWETRCSEKATANAICNSLRNAKVVIF